MIFIDEISMVGNSMFNIQINNRRKDIKGGHLPFVTVSIVAIGDLFHLQPVIMDIYLRTLIIQSILFLHPTFAKNMLECLNCMKL